MAIIGAQIAGKWFKPFEDDDAEYLIRPLNNTDYATVFMVHSDLVGTIDGEGLMIAFLHGVEDWKQVFTEDGKEATRTVENINRMPRKHFYNVANEILDISRLGADEIKNS